MSSTSNLARGASGLVLHDWSKTHKSWSSLDRGLDLSQPDVTTVQEWESWRQHDRAYRGYPLPSYDLVGQMGRPDAVKRWFSQIPTFYATNAQTFSGIPVFVHLYAITGFTEGLVYEIDNCESRGYSREAVADVLALAFLHAPSASGMFHVHDAVLERMETYTDPATTIEFPEGWTNDPPFFDCGLDFSSQDMQDGELAKIEDWYREITGEVPGFVSFLGRHRPNLLKSYRNRFEHALRVLPNQVMPYLLLNYEVHRGFAPGIRDAVLLCRGFGLAKAQAMDAVAWGMLYGGHGGMTNAAAAAGDLFDDEDWE